MKYYTRLYLIRHGRLINSHLNIYNGQRDIELSPEGVSQTIGLSGWFKDKPISAIYSSDLKRSYDGAKIIAVSLGLEVTQVAAFREINFGRWEGLTAEEIEKWYKEDWGRWMADIIYAKPTDGESLIGMQGRVIKRLRTLTKRHLGEEIILYTHAGVNRAILCHALNLNMKYCFRIQQDFCGVSIIDFHESTAVVRLMNWSPEYTLGLERIGKCV